MVDISALLKAAVASSDDTKAVMVLAGTSVNLYASPLTPNDMKNISRKHPNFMLQPSMEGMIDLIILKAKGDDGLKMFTIEHRPDLMRLSSNIVTGVFGELFGEQLTSDEDEDSRKGKSKATS